MKTIKVIDLLNMIANGEIPEKIKFIDRIWEYDDVVADYSCFLLDHYEYLLNNISFSCINEKVEIIEEETKIPETLDILNANEHSKEVYYENYSKEEISLDIETLQLWVNKIIDYLKSKGE